MKSSFHQSLWFALGILISSAVALAAPPKGKKAAVVSKDVDFQRTKSRIDTLLGPRLKSEPLPDPLPNPFQLAEVAPMPGSDKTPKPVENLPVSTDSEMLLYYGASLRISGTVRTDDETHLIINSSPYKVGDLLTIKTKDSTAKLRILGIAPGELTLGLNDAVQVIKFKK
ncbi:MAG TPA: hypothetical protein VGM64_08340 [Lacunisphaera sp.]|jgi:hypothetical protein